MSDGPNTWRELQTLFDLVDRTPASEREQVLGSACGDPALRTRVLRMIEGANQDIAPLPSPAEPSAAPRQFGPYQVLRVIGSGGIGTVYLAERLLGGAPHRVAIKALSPHAAGPHFVERFHREQHILAILDHPNITRLLDAGLGDAGQPYLVMDFVEGVHLDEHCATTPAACLSISSPTTALNDAPDPTVAARSPSKSSWLARSSRWGARRRHWRS